MQAPESTAVRHRCTCPMCGHVNHASSLKTQWRLSVRQHGLLCTRKCIPVCNLHAHKQVPNDVSCGTVQLRHAGSPPSDQALLSQLLQAALPQSFNEHTPFCPTRAKCSTGGASSAAHNALGPARLAASELLSKQCLSLQLPCTLL